MFAYCVDVHLVLTHIDKFGSVLGFVLKVWSVLDLRRSYKPHRTSTSSAEHCTRNMRLHRDCIDLVESSCGNLLAHANCTMNNNNATVLVNNDFTRPRNLVISV